MLESYEVTRIRIRFCIHLLARTSYSAHIHLVHLKLCDLCYSITNCSWRLVLPPELIGRWNLSNNGCQGDWYRKCKELSRNQTTTVSNTLQMDHFALWSAETCSTVFPPSLNMFFYPLEVLVYHTYRELVSKTHCNQQNITQRIFVEEGPRHLGLIS